MKKDLLNKLIAAITVVCLMMTYVTTLTNSVFAAYEELEKQGIVSNNKNVEFDAYFKEGETNKHSISADIFTEQKLYVKVNVKNVGYLANAVISIDSPNYAIKNTFAGNENVKSIDYANNQFTLNQIEAGKDVEIEIPVQFVRNDNMNLDYFAKETKLNLTGTYFDENGKERNIKSSIDTRLDWSANKNAKIFQDVRKYGRYETEDASGVYMQTELTSLLENNALPIKSTKINVSVPKIADKLPEEIRIFVNTTATNGDSDGIMFTNDMWSYNKDTGMLEVNINNEETDNQVVWKQGEDKLYITYIYKDTEFAPVKVNLNADVTIQTYVDESEVKANENKEIELKEEKNNLVDLQTSATQEINKGYMYANNKYETTYSSIINANIAYADAVERIVINDKNPQFIMDEDEMIQASNNIYYKSISLKKNIFDKLLGENGTIEIFDQNNKKIGGIDKNTEADANGNINIEINNQNVSEIRIETSKPLTEGILTLNLNKAVKSKTSLNRATVHAIKSMDTIASGEIQFKDMIMKLAEVKATTNLKETSTRAELYINNTNLTTTAKNENVEIKVILKSNDNTCDLYQNPTVEIRLPNEIENLEIKTINLLYNEGIMIKSYDVITNKNGEKVIRVNMQGEQTEFVTDISKGINLVINTDITLKRTAASNNKEATLKITNEKAIQYENDGTYKLPMNIYAPQGVVLLSSVSNFDNDNDEVVSLANKEQAGKIETMAKAKEVTLKATVINNYGKDIKNPKILGRIPFEGNKKTNGEDLGTTLNTVVTSGIGVSGIDSKYVTIYYSESGEATEDLNNAENGWTTKVSDWSKVRSYLVELKDYTMPQATSFDMAYKVQVPGNLNHNENAFGTYTVFYDDVEGDQVIPQKTIAPTVGVSTGKGPELNAEITANAENTASTQDVIEYKVKVKNDGEVDATNAKVRVNLPEMVDYAEFIQEAMGSRYEVRPEIRTVEVSVGDIKVGETKEASFTIKANKEGNFKLTVELVADNLEKPSQVETAELQITKASFYIEFLTPTEENSTVGSQIEYYLNISNATEEKINNVEATVNLPENVEYVEAFSQGYAGDDQSTDGVKYDEKEKKITFDVGDIEANSGAARNFIFRVKPTKEETVNMQVEVSGNNVANQKSEIIRHTVGKGKLDVTTSTDVDKEYLQLGDEITYTVRVKNTSSGIIKNVKVSVTLPENLKYLNTTYSIDDLQIFDGYLLENRVSSATVDLNAGETLIFVVKAAVNKITDPSKEEEDSTVEIDVEGDDTDKFEDEITNKIENDDVQDGSTFRISGSVWYDENRNGTKDNNERLLSGIPVSLVDAETGKAVRNSNGDDITAITDNNGEYILSDIIKGKYIVKFQYDNSTYSITEYRKQGIDDDVNSDAINTTENNGIAITDSLEITDSSMSNIDLGLTTKGIFDLELDKSITKVQTADGKNTKSTDLEKDKITKIDVDGKRADSTNAVIEYTITITNKGNVPGYAKKVVDYIPEQLEFSSNLNKDWYMSGDVAVNTSLENEIINPGESKELKLILTKKVGEEVIDTITNKAEITESYNDQGLLDETSNEDQERSSANVIVGIKTGGPVTYITLTLAIFAIIGCGAYLINKKVLNK